MVLGRLGLMTVIAMSRAEIDRVHVLRDIMAGRIAVREAAQLLQITQRQVFRAPGVQIAQGLLCRRSRSLSVEPARQAKQPLLPGGAAN